MKKLIFFLFLAFFIGATISGSSLILNKGSSEMSSFISENTDDQNANLEKRLVEVTMRADYYDAAASHFLSISERTMFSNLTAKIACQVFGSENFYLVEENLVSSFKKSQEGFMTNPICESDDSFSSLTNSTTDATKLTPQLKNGPTTVLKKPIAGSNFLTSGTNV
jgi:hypothetical protein